MSHFSVLVIGPNPEAQLAPYHEFECTGRDDQYVVDVDKTEEAREGYAMDTVSRFRDSQGSLYSPYEDRFYRDPLPTENVGMGTGVTDGLTYHSKDWGDGKGHRAKVHYMPDGFEKVTVPVSQVRTFVEFCRYEYDRKTVAAGDTPDLKDTHKYGHIRLDANGEVLQVINRTNPNAKWDWYVIGGRYKGRFILKPDAPGTSDQALKGDIDFSAMRAKAYMQGATRYDAMHEVIAGRKMHAWDHVRLVMFKDDIKAARDYYHAQPVVQDVNQSAKVRDLCGPMVDIEDYLVSRETYLDTARAQALSAFAVVRDGQWSAHGDMGWFACVSNETMSWVDWVKGVNALVDSLPDDTLLTMVDCHI